MSNPLPSMPPGRPGVAIPVESSSGVWDRLTTWVSENKAVVYTIAGVAVVVTGAGVVYYLNDAVRSLVLEYFPVIAAKYGPARHIILYRTITRHEEL